MSPLFHVLGFSTIHSSLWGIVQPFWKQQLRDDFEKQSFEHFLTAKIIVNKIVKSGRKSKSVSCSYKHMVTSRYKPPLIKPRINTAYVSSQVTSWNSFLPKLFLISFPAIRVFGVMRYQTVISQWILQSYVFHKHSWNDATIVQLITGE